MGSNTLYTLDLATGVLTAIGPTTGAPGFSGLAIVPEPGSAAVLLAGLMTSLRRGQNRRRQGC